MKLPTLRLAVLLWFFATMTFLTHPSPVFAFGGEEAGKGQCSKCHLITNTEAEEILKDLVDDVHAVDLSDVPGLYIVDATGKNGKRGLLYMDFSRKYVIAGNFISIDDKINITQREMSRLRSVDPAAIPLEDSLVLGNPDAAVKLILFTDPQCPFCRKLHPELERVVKADPDIAFYIKMMPLVNLHPDSLRISKSILCQNSVELLKASFAGKKVPDPTCKTDAVEKTLQLAQELGISSTPTLILPDGRILSGYKPAEEIIKLLKEKQP